MGRPRPRRVHRWHLKNPSLLFDHSITFTALVQPHEASKGEEGRKEGFGGSPLFCVLHFFLPGNFLPAHSCVITGSAGGQCRARWTDGRGDLVCSRPLMTRGSSCSRSVVRSSVPLFCRQLNPIDRMTLNTTSWCRVFRPRTLYLPLFTQSLPYL